MALSERQKFVKEKELCTNGFWKGHLLNKCSKSSFCSIEGCNRKHNYWLHEAKEDETPIPQTTGTGVQITKTRRREDSKLWMSLRTIPVVLESPGNRITVNAQLDDGGTTSYVSNAVADELSLLGENQILRIKKATVKREEVVTDSSFQEEPEKMNCCWVNLCTTSLALTTKGKEDTMVVIDKVEEIDLEKLNDIIVDQVVRKTNGDKTVIRKSLRLVTEKALVKDIVDNGKIENTVSLELKGVSRKAVIYGKKGKQNRTVQKGTFPQLGQTLFVKEILNLMKSVKVGKQSKSCVLKSFDLEFVGVRGCSHGHSRRLDNRVWHRWMEK